jgi:uncharacterized protein with HEPN domain
MEIVEASACIRNEMHNNIRKSWLIELGVGIISEASRRLPDDLKARHPEIPWQEIAGIDGLLWSCYDDLMAFFVRKILDDLPRLEAVCNAELTDPAKPAR